MSLSLRRLLLAALALAVLSLSCRARVSVGPAGGDPQATTQTASAAPSDDDRIPVGAEDPSKGGDNAYVTVVVFTDFRCPYCNRLSPTIDRIRESYAQDVLRIVFKHMPSPNLAYAKLASTVGQGVYALKGAESFWKYRDVAFRDQQSVTPETIRQWGLAAGLDKTELDVGLEKGAWADKVERDMSLSARLGVTEPPASFVNGVQVAGAPPFDVFKDVIEAELAKAKILEQNGVARADIYRRAVAANSPDASHGDNEIADPKVIWRVPVGNSPVRGKATAYVTVVEFSDFDCAPCRRAAQTLSKIRTDFGDKVRLVWKDLPPPSHPRATPAAYMARAARAQKGDAGFWDMHDRLFAASKLDDSDLELMARSAGLEPRSAMATLKSESFRKEVEADVELGEDVEVNVTPHFFVNGRRLVGEQTYERMKAMVEEEIKKAESLLRSGIEPTALYDWFIKDGRPGDVVKKTVPLPANAPSRGPANAPLVVQEFAEFQCAPCRRAEPILEEVMRAYPNMIRVVWRDFPTAGHAEAPLAAEAGREAFSQKGNDAFWKMHDRLFANPKALQRDDLEAHAKEIGLETGRFHRTLDARFQKPLVDADIKVANEAGIVTAPTFVIGNYIVPGVPTFARFKRIVGRALAEAPSNQGRPQGGGGGAVAGGGGVNNSPSGTKFSIVDLVVGSGPPAKHGDTLNIHYRGKLLDGTEFDSSYRRGPFSFTLGSGMVIQGWERGLVGMRVGGKRRITIPPELGYGNHGVGKSIPPNATLVFDVDLLSIQ